MVIVLKEKFHCKQIEWSTLRVILFVFSTPDKRSVFVETISICNHLFSKTFSHHNNSNHNRNSLESFKKFLKVFLSTFGTKSLFVYV